MVVWFSYLNYAPLLIDVDECKMSPCKNGTCLNTFGSFLCTCPEGSKLDITALGCTGKFILAIWRPHANSYVCNLSFFVLLKNTTVETVKCAIDTSFSWSVLLSNMALDQSGREKSLILW